MTMADALLPAPDFAHHATTEQIRLPNGSFKTETPQEQSTLEDKIAEFVPLKLADGGADTGCITSVAGWEEGKDRRDFYMGITADNGQHMYYGPNYGYQSSYSTQPQGPYISNMGAGSPAYGQAYGHFYPQVPHAVTHYYPTEQEGPKTDVKKQSPKDGPNQKVKPAIHGRQGYQAGYNNYLPPDPANQWGPYPPQCNGGFYNSTNGYDLYSQQWHSSAHGFQPIHPPQNVGVQGNYIPPLPGGGPGRYNNMPRVHSASNLTGKGYKGNSLKGPTGANWRAKETTKIPNKSETSENIISLSDNDTPVSQNQVSLITKSKIHPITTLESETPCLQSDTSVQNHGSSINRDDYNKENFQISYEKAKFFIIKSYSEDDVHKSIKYAVWSSTPNGNKRLDEAYKKAEEQSQSLSNKCPVFFFFSVNSSGQFCGVAEMVGAVDFTKNMDFWLQGKWNGCLPVKWHIVKDVPNGHFRHIILANNENKPVTHSRDTQEVHFHQGLEMLKIFKFFPMRTSLLDDFAFYDGRQKVLQERKTRQQYQQQRHQVVKQFKEKSSGKVNNPTGDDKMSNDKENGVPMGNGTTVESLQLKMAELNTNIGSALKVESNNNNGNDENPKEKIEVKDVGIDSGALKIGDKDEFSKTIINYKKALLGEKGIVLDQPN